MGGSSCCEILLAAALGRALPCLLPASRIDLERVRAFFRSLVPPTYRDDYARLLHHLGRGLSGVVHGQLIICVINGTLAALGFWALGVPYALLWGALAGVTNLIPFFGIIIATAPVVVISLLTSEPSGIFGLSGAWLALAVVGWALVINLLEGNLFEPKIIGKKAKIHPVLVLFAVLAGEYAFGVAGMVFAVPTLSIVLNLFLFFKEKAQRGPPTVPATPGPQATPPA